MPKVPGQLTSLIITLLRRCLRALLCTSKKGALFSICTGSLTVEATVVLPLFLLATLSMVSVMDVCRIQTEEQTQLCQRAKRMATIAYGVSEEEYIDLATVKSCELPASLIPGYRVPVALRGRVHAWIGRTYEECEKDLEIEVEPLVYVTEYESVYHESAECTHLKLSIYSVDGAEVIRHKNEYGNKYSACDKCCGESGAEGICYISPQGDRYHNSRQCSGLTRRVKLIKASEVSQLSVCSRCGGL